MLGPLNSALTTTPAPMGEASALNHMHCYGMDYHRQHVGVLGGHNHAHLSQLAASVPRDTDPDSRELEVFAVHFKQRRIKLGATQAGVGKAIANLKLPGVSALSQTTICRFECLRLTRENMTSLKPVLQAWLDEAEAQAKDKHRDPDAPKVLETKRKRTSITAIEKLNLEAYFAVQPRPCGNKLTAISEKLDLKKSVVRLWFCNQRQKQKSMKFAAQHRPAAGGRATFLLPSPPPGALTVTAHPSAPEPRGF